jgi:hypothetical protein
LLAQGLGVGKDLVRAEALVTRACDGDIATACHNLGLMLGNNPSIGKDPASAFARACALGYARACTRAP